jgi:hypothetical protein
MLLLILLVILILSLTASVPIWPHSRGWGYYPSVFIGLVVLILLGLSLSEKL